MYYPEFKNAPVKWTALACSIAMLVSVSSFAGNSSDDSNRYLYRGDHYKHQSRDACKRLKNARFEETVEIATAKLYVEYNFTDDDIGVHGAFDDDGYSLLCIYDPMGKPVLQLQPRNQLKDLTVAGIFFESREPPGTEFSFADLKEKFTEGNYRVRGVTYEGTGLTGAALFTHDVPLAPEITFPVDGAVVSASNLTISWENVTQTVDSNEAEITGYEVIITKEAEDDPNGFSRPTYDVHVPADRNTLSVPAEFLEPETEYELEILALEVSGNQTISVLFFETE